MICFDMGLHSSTTTGIAVHEHFTACTGVTDTPSKSADLRLKKAAVRRARLQQDQRVKFLEKVNSTTSSAESQRSAQELVSRVRAAKSADFLDQYRIAV